MFNELHARLGDYRLHTRKIWFWLAGLGLSLHTAILASVKEAVISPVHVTRQYERFPSFSINALIIILEVKMSSLPQRPLLLPFELQVN